MTTSTYRVGYRNSLLNILRKEAKQDGICPVCGTTSAPTVCPECGGRLIEWSPTSYCVKCGHIMPTEKKGY